MKWKCSCMCMALAACLIVALPAQANIFVDPAPSPSWVGPGQVFTVDIWADITKDPVLGWGLDMDLTLLSGNSLTLTLFPPTIGPDWDAAFAPDGDGLAGLAFPAGISGVTLLASVPILVNDCVPLPGDVHCVLDITLSDSNPTDLTEGFALENPPGGFATNVIYGSAQVLIKPEPATLSLLVIAGLAIPRRRRR